MAWAGRAFPCQVLQQQRGPFLAQPEGPGLFLRDAALLDTYLEYQTSCLVPCLAQKQAPARPRMKWQQTLAKLAGVAHRRVPSDASI
ncbi:MAG TPA: hypothetical protein DEH10_19805 [Pseudomonas sp.]|nr:hypothetical protein [Pseudomonas sp.]